MSDALLVTLETLAATAQLALLVGVGVVLTRAGVLDAAGRKTLSQLSYYVFIPALSFIRLATQPSLGSAAAFLPVNTAVAIAAGTAMGHTVAAVVRPPPAIRPHVVAAAAFGNLANLPLVIVHALCQGKAARSVLLPGGGGGGAKACADTGAALVLAPVWVASFLQFLLADRLLRKGASDAPNQAADDGDATELVPLSSALASASSASAAASPFVLQRDDSKLAKVLADGLTAALPPSTPSLPSPTATAAENGGATPPPPATPPSPLAAALATAATAVRAVLVPPSLAALTGLAVGACHPTRALFEGEAAPLALLTSVLETLGGAMIPSLMLVLGGELAPGPAAARVPPRALAAASAARLLAMPLLGGAWLTAARAAGVVRPPSPLFAVVCLLAWSTPAAIILSTLAVKHANAPAVMAALLFWSYVGRAATLPLVATAVLRAV